MWKILTAASTALVLLGTPALAQMAEWDANADSSVDEMEFGTGFGAGGVFGEWDADADAQLSEDEFTTGFGDKYDEEKFGAFADLDADGSGGLSEDEFKAGILAGYDADDDGMLSQDEFGEYEGDEWF
jgi:hypothetical protein